MKVNIDRVGNKKLEVSIDVHDVWNLDSTLAQIIFPALLQLKATSQGAPSEFAIVGGEEYADQLSFDFYIESCTEARDIKIKQWDDILDKMIWSFYQIAFDEYDEKYHRKYSVLDNERVYDHVGFALHEERVQEGLTLFGEYYRGLWT